MRPTRSHKPRGSFTFEGLEDRRMMAVAASDEALRTSLGLGWTPARDPGVAEIATPSMDRGNAGQTFTVASLVDDGLRADTRTATTMRLVGAVPGGMRGETTTFQVLLRDAGGRPLSGRRIDFTQTYGGRDKTLPSATTDDSGLATLTYRIPVDPNADNIALTARFGGTSSHKSSSYTVSHVEIGRRGLSVDVTGPAGAVDEGKGATFTFSLSQAAKTSVTVRYATSNGTAASGTDFVGATGSVTFAAGEKSKKVTVATLADAVVDRNETFTMRIVSAQGAKIGTSSVANATIRDTTPAPTPAPTPTPTGSWTVLVYMTGSNLNDFASEDINEMERAMAGYPAGVRIVVSWDQPASDFGYETYSTANGSQPAWGGCGRSVLQADTNMASIASRFDLTVGEQNTGDPRALVDFVKWGVHAAPAQHYVLQMWGHGGGFYGSQFDLESDDDSLTPRELASALRTEGMPKIDVLAYDNCLMAMAEVGTAIASSVPGVFVASEELVNGRGQDYTTVYSRLVTANPATVTAAKVAEGMVASYQKQYQGDARQHDTLSSMSAAGYAALDRALAGFVAATAGLGNAERATLTTAAKASPSYGGSIGSVDLAGFMSRAETAALPKGVRAAASTVKAALAAMTTSRTADQRGSGGMAVYLPTDARNADMTTYVAEAADFCRATGWDSFVRWITTGSRAAVTSTPHVGFRAAPVTIGSTDAISLAAWASYAGTLDVAPVPESPLAIRRIRG
jgi:hypothetical protein